MRRGCYVFFVVFLAFSFVKEEGSSHLVTRMFFLGDKSVGCGIETKHLQYKPMGNDSMVNSSENLGSRIQSMMK